MVSIQGQNARQIGNAAPVELAMTVADHMADTLSRRW